MKRYGITEARKLFVNPDFIYKIYNEIDIEGESLTLPSGCTLDFQGGLFTSSSSGGTLVGNETTVLSNGGDCFTNIEQEGSWKEETFSDKPYLPESYSGFGKVYLKKNVVNGENILTQSMMNKANTIYVIQYDYDLNGETIEVPEGCVLKFDGGSINNGSIINNNTKIINIPNNMSNILGAFYTDYGYLTYNGHPVVDSRSEIHALDTIVIDTDTSNLRKYNDKKEDNKDNIGNITEASPNFSYTIVTVEN